MKNIYLKSKEARINKIIYLAKNKAKKIDDENKKYVRLLRAIFKKELKEEKKEIEYFKLLLEHNGFIKKK
jgi:RNase P subunit RPR2